MKAKKQQKSPNKEADDISELLELAQKLNLPSNSFDGDVEAAAH